MTKEWKKPKFGIDDPGAYIYCPFTKEMCRKSPCIMWDSDRKLCLIQAAAAYFYEEKQPGIPRELRFPMETFIAELEEPDDDEEGA